MCAKRTRGNEMVRGKRRAEGESKRDGPDDELAEVTSRAKSLLLALAVGSSRDVGPEMMDRSPSRSHSSPPSISHPFTLL